jgi:hypothetical protein
VSVVVVATWPLAIRLVRNNRRSVLFLRRFGDTDATSVVTDAVWRIGASWRVVTLDDETVAPVGNNARATVTSRVVFGVGRTWQLVFTKPLPVVKAVAKVAGWGAGIVGVILVALAHGSLSHRINVAFDYGGVVASSSKAS